MQVVLALHPGVASHNFSQAEAEDKISTYLSGNNFASYQHETENIRDSVYVAHQHNAIKAARLHTKEQLLKSGVRSPKGMPLIRSNGVPRNICNTTEDQVFR